MNNSKLLDIGLFKTIPLYPTLFHVDIWICNNPDNLSEYFHKRYGAGKEYHRENNPGFYSNESCLNCSNNPKNGGSGICHCILGQQVSY